MQLNVKFLLIFFLISVVDLKVLLKEGKITDKSELKDKERKLIRANSTSEFLRKKKSVMKANSKKNNPGDYPSIIAFGDTGQVDVWFYENIARKIVEKSPIFDTKDAKLKLQENATNVKFDNFEELINFAKSRLSKNFYDELVILGDSIYTDHKKGKIKSVAPKTFFKVSDAKVTDKAKNLNKQIKSFDYFGKELDDEIDGSSLTTIFKNRLTKASDALTQMFSKMDFLKTGAKISILPGNHSTDIDDLVERTHTKDKLKDSSLTAYFPKHSKVQKQGKVCYLDINAGDVQLYTAYYNTENLANAEVTEDLKAVFDKINTKDQEYDDAITKGAFSDMSYGRNKVDTLIGALKIYEAALTLKHCAKSLYWRVIRTHVAPFNAEVDYGAYFGIKKGVVCKKIFGNDAYVDFTKFDIANFKSDEIDDTQLKKEDAKGRLYDCKYDTEKKAKPVSIMEAIDSTQPHFWLGSHLHASQIIAAPYIGSGNRGTEFKQSKKLTIPKDVSGPLCINRFAEVKKESFSIPATKEDYRKKMNESIKQCTGSFKEIISIDEDNPGFHLIFVIGNSGRFLDPLFSAECSLSEILWQRASIPGNKFIEDHVDLLAKDFDITKIDTFKTTFIQPIKDINEKTNYGFATITFSETSAVIELHENVNNVVAAITVTKVKGGTDGFKKLINEKGNSPTTLQKYKNCLKP